MAVNWGPETERFTKPQLEALWVQAGGPQVLADIASAVAMGESLGDPKVTFKNFDAYLIVESTDRGLWQINDKWHPVPDPNVYYDPLTNAKKAVEIFRSNGNSFIPWNAYKNGSYRRWLTDKSRGEPKDYPVQF